VPRGFRPNRRRGQNLLLDQSIADRIVGDADLPPGANVLEIGAGSGVLTNRLARVAGSLAAVEVDYELAAALRDTTKKFDNVKVIRADAREIDVPLLFEGAPFHVVANLPYSVGTPLTVDLVKDEYRPVTLTVMLQREVADRMCAGPGDMALLSVLVQSFAAAGKLFEVPPKAFWPRPKVHSAVVRLVTNEVDADEPLVRAAVFLARLGFASRRKMLHNSLAGGLRWESERVTDTCRKAGVESSIRPEELGLDEWQKLAEAFVAEGILERPDGP
jgi:16S rRNA (adenine1518-N6/adenine1519-N6)-dimethyltransferase